MKLISINIGSKRTLQRKNGNENTGIFKLPVDGSVKIEKLGIKSDFIASTKHHGGPDQAIYIYGLADYQWWSKELGREIPPGTFGENLTISELESADFNIGDFLHIEEVTLQITAPRIPCGTFASRMEDPAWVKKFRQAERPGLYCRVMREGFVSTGDLVSVEKYNEKTLSVLEMYRGYYEKDKSEEVLRQHLDAPIDIRSRIDLEKELQKVLQQ